jgi:RimJ/RimL family protein N-acetyltransferase
MSPEHLKETWKAALEHREPPRSIWFIAESDRGVPAGVCGLQSINYIHGDAVVPIFVSSRMRLMGLAQAMSVLVIDTAFEKLRLHRLTTFFREDNLATPAITKKLGFVKEGCMREAWYSDGRHKDVIQVGLLKETWLKQREVLRAALENSEKIAINTRRSS